MTVKSCPVWLFFLRPFFTTVVPKLKGSCGRVFLPRYSCRFGFETLCLEVVLIYFSPPVLRGFSSPPPFWYLSRFSVHHSRNRLPSSPLIVPQTSRISPLRVQYYSRDTFRVSQMSLEDTLILTKTVISTHFRSPTVIPDFPDLTKSGVL